MLFLRETPSHFFGTSKLAPVDGHLGLISETRMASGSVTISKYLMHSKRRQKKPSCPQVAFQHQPQSPRIEIGPDLDQRRARQDRYAGLLELQICVSDDLDIWERNWKQITFVMSFASCVESLKDILSWPTSHDTGKHLPSDKVRGRCPTHSHHRMNPKVGPVRESRLLKLLDRSWWRYLHGKSRRRSATRCSVVNPLRSSSLTSNPTDAKGYSRVWR